MKEGLHLVPFYWKGDPLKAEKSPFGPFFDENGSANAQLGIQKPLIEELLKAWSKTFLKKPS